MGQAGFAGARKTGAAADEPGHRDVVMGTPKGTLGDEPGLIREQPRDGIDPGYVKRLVAGHGRKDAGQAAGQHGLARTWRPDQ